MPEQGGAPRATVLLVEDDPQVAGLQMDILERSGYRVRWAEHGEQARAMLEQERPDLIVLDLMLPDVDGLLLSTRLRSSADIPLIICSARNQLRERVLGLKLGADDFIAKPFHPDEFEARIDAVLRRAARQAEERTPEPAEQVHVGQLVIERFHRSVALNGQPLELTPTEFRLLLALASRAGEVVSREELAQVVWGYQDASSGRTIDVHILRLRAKLERGGGVDPRIVTSRGVGYMLRSVGEGTLPVRGSLSSAAPS